MKFPQLLFAALLLTPLAPAQAERSAKADFTDGFPGSAGNGWSNHWKTYPGDPSTSFQIETASEPPLPGAQTYLSIQSLPRSESIKSTSLYMIRPVETDVATSRTPFTASWVYRWDDLEHGEPESFNASFVIFPESASGGPGGSLVYITIIKQRWHVVRNNGTGQPFFQKTTLAAEPGQSFTFKVNVDPASSSYTVEIESSTGESYASEALSSLCTTKEPETISFRAAMGGVDAQFKASLGNIEISPNAAPQP